MTYPPNSSTLTADARRACFGLVAITTLMLVATESLAALPYLEDRQPPAERLYHAGLVFTGINHHDGTGVGLQFEYGGFRREPRPLRFSFEALFVSSGERRLSKYDAYNDYFLQDSVLFAPINTVYESFMTIVVGGSVHYVITSPPPWLSVSLPGVALGVAAGGALETDRVGLLSSEYVEYYGYDSYSDTNYSLRPYVRPKVVFTNGPLSVVFSTTFLTEFLTWNVGIAYGW